MQMKNRRSPLMLGPAVLTLSVGTSGPVRLHAQDGGRPSYEVDVSWPKPWPGRWVIGPIGAVCVDSKDHVLLLNRQTVLDVDLDAGTKAPPVIEVDPAGNVVNSWGEGVFTPILVESFHSCHFDPDDNVWILSTDSGMVQKFSHDGSKLLLQIGKSDVVDSSDGTLKGKPLNSDAALFFAPADVAVHRKTGDIYVDDGDSAEGNRRIAVMDRTGKFVRQWQPQDLRSIHCMALSNDDLVYVCDRAGNQIHVYDLMGNFQKAIDIPWKAHTPVAPGEKRRSGSAGAAVSVTLSRDPAQRFMYVNNQNNSQIEVLDRQSGKVLSSFGRSGHLPGQFDQPLNIAVDSKGNVYVTENRGKRVQRFSLQVDF